MAKKPSERRNFKDEGMELNLTPMMNLISILIPALLISTAFVEIAVVNVAAPAIGSAPEDQQDKPPDKPPLNLTITITDQGYTVSTSGEIMPGPSGDGKGPTIPMAQKTVECKKFLGTVPPPRKTNVGSGKCEAPEDARPFMVYDVTTLQDKLVTIKDAFPDERRMIIGAEPDVEFEAITDVMDAGRDLKDEAGEVRVLFDEVVLSPAMS